MKLSLHFYQLSLMFLFSFFSQEGNTQEPHPTLIKIGVIQSLTGIAAEDGKTVVQSLQMATDDFNKTHQKTKVELIVEDDLTQPSSSVSALEKLSAQGVETIVGATWDFTTNAILKLAARKGIIIFNTSTLMESLNLSEAQGYVFVNALSANDEANAFDKFLTKRKFQNMTVAFANNSWGETQLKIYKNIASKHNVKILDEIPSSTFDANDWSPLIARLKQKKSEMILLLLNKTDLEIFLRKSKEQGLQTSYFASKNLFDALRISPYKSLFEGACFTYPLDRLGKEIEFLARYKERFNEDSRIYADNSYDALFIIVKAITASRDNNISIKDAFKLTKYEGLVGNYKFNDEKSFCLGSSSLVCVERGEVVLQN